MADNILLTPKQAAEYLNVTVAKVRKDIFERRVETIKVGRLVRIRKAFLDQLIQQNTRPARDGEGYER